MDTGLGKALQSGARGAKTGGVSDTMMSFRSRFLSYAVPLAVAALLGAGVQVAQATPSGLSNYPSTDVYPDGGFHFDSDYFSGLNNTGSLTTGSSIGLEYGLGDNSDKAFGRNELGVDFLTFPNSQANAGQRFLLNGKSQLFSNSDTRLVAGFYGVGSKRVAAGDWIYLLGSKNFSFGRVHLGVAQSLAGRDVNPKNRTVVQLGYDKAINDKFIFALDYQSGSTQFIAPGIIYNINDKAGIELSYLRGGNSVSPRNQVYFGFDYNFGKTAPASTEDTPADKGADGSMDGGGVGAPSGSGTSGGG